ALAPAAPARGRRARQASRQACSARLAGNDRREYGARPRAAQDPCEAGGGARASPLPRLYESRDRRGARRPRANSCVAAGGSEGAPAARARGLGGMRLGTFALGGV